MKNKSQKQRIIDYLLTGRSLTKLQILQKFGCLSAGQRIDELRDNPPFYPIHTDMIPKKDGHGKYARYSLVKKP
jgi:hypothetical protein